MYSYFEFENGKMVVINQDGWKSLIEDHTCHYITIAADALTSAKWEIVEISGMSPEDVSDVFNRVNVACEAGTLYPKHRITVLPCDVLPKSEGIRDADWTFSKTCLTDIRMAQSLFGSDTVLLDLRDFEPRHNKVCRIHTLSMIKAIFEELVDEGSMKKFAVAYRNEPYLINGMALGINLWDICAEEEKLLMQEKLAVDEAMAARIRREAEKDVRYNEHKLSAEQKRESLLEGFAEATIEEKLWIIAGDRSHLPDYYPVDLSQITDDTLYAIPEDLKKALIVRFSQLLRKDWKHFYNRLNKTKEDN